MYAHLKRQAQLGADAIGARDQDWLPVAGGYFAERAKTTQTAQYFRASSASGNVFDALHQCIAGVDIHAGIFVAEGFALIVCAHGVRGPIRLRAAAVAGGVF